MTPAVILLLALAAILVWFLAAGAFRLIGGLFGKIGKDAIDIVLDKDEKEKEE